MWKTAADDIKKGSKMSYGSPALINPPQFCPGKKKKTAVTIQLLSRYIKIYRDYSTY